MPPLTIESIAWASQLAAALGVGGVVVKLVDGWLAERSGKHDRELERIHRALDDRDAADARARHESACRRIVTEYAHRLRLQLIGLDVEPEPFPELPKED